MICEQWFYHNGLLLNEVKKKVLKFQEGVMGFRQLKCHTASIFSNFFYVLFLKTPIVIRSSHAKIPDISM